MILFHITDEGDKLHEGFNFYPLSCEHSFGMKIKLFRLFLLFRYAKKRKTKKFIFQIKTWKGTEWVEELQTNAMINIKEWGFSL